MQTVGAVLLEVAKLAGGIIHTGSLQTLGVILVLGEDLDDGGGQRRAAHKDHAADLGLAHKRHDARSDGHGDACLVGKLAEAVEALVIKEELCHKEARAGVLLLLEVLDREIKILAGNVALGVGCGAHAKAGVNELGDEVASIGVVRGGLVVLGRAGGQVAAQGQHVFHAGRAILIDLGGDIGMGAAYASEVRDRGRIEFARDHMCDGGGGGAVARATGGTSDRDKARRKLAQVARHFASRIEGKLALGREHLKRNGCGALGCCLLKNLVDAHIVLL